MPDVRSQRVLIVSEAPPTRDVLKSALFAAGLRRLGEARSAPEALDHLLAHPCDVAVIDCDTISEPWLALVRQVREARTTRNLPILVLVGRYETGAVRAAIDAGVDGVLVKPVAPGVLRRRIAALIGSRDCVLLDAPSASRVRLI